MASATFTADTASLLYNPERGTSYLIESLSTLSAGAVSTRFATGDRLITFRQLLNAYYQTSTLPQGFLDNLNTGAGYLRSGGMKAVMSFSYDNTDAGTEPTRAIMLGHIAQLKDFWADNRDVIAFAHAGFLGTYGEWAGWHVSGDSELQPFGDWTPTASMRAAVKDALLANVHHSIPIMWRIPVWARNEWGLSTAPGAAQSMNGSWQHRLSSIHNDCWLSDINDAGTYWSYPGSWPRDLSNAYRAWHVACAEWANTGGENCSGTGAYANLADATTDAQNYAWTYCRTDWGNFWSIMDSGGNGTTMRNRLGYRLQLDSISHSDSVTAGNTVTFTVGMRNLGNARVRNTSERRLQIRLTKSGASDITGQSHIQLRQLPRQATRTYLVPVTVTVPGGATAGSYDVHIEAPDCFSSIADVRAFRIKFANANSGGQTWDDTNGRWATGTTVTVT